jgi:hypothetical protein
MFLTAAGKADAAPPSPRAATPTPAAAAAAAAAAEAEEEVQRLQAQLREVQQELLQARQEHGDEATALKEQVASLKAFAGRCTLTPLPSTPAPCWYATPGVIGYPQQLPHCCPCRVSPCQQHVNRP